MAVSTFIFKIKLLIFSDKLTNTFILKILIRKCSKFKRDLKVCKRLLNFDTDIPNLNYFYNIF